MQSVTLTAPPPPAHRWSREALSSKGAWSSESTGTALCAVGPGGHMAVALSLPCVCSVPAALSVARFPTA